MTEKYVPHPVDTSGAVLPESLMELVEVMSKNTHDVWAQTRIEQGWVFGDARDDEKKLHPCLIPYEELPECEKEFDRNTALETLRLITTLGYKITKE